MVRDSGGQPLSLINYDYAYHANAIIGGLEEKLLVTSLGG